MSLLKGLHLFSCPRVYFFWLIDWLIDLPSNEKSSLYGQFTLLTYSRKWTVLARSLLLLYFRFIGHIFIILQRVRSAPFVLKYSQERTRTRERVARKLVSHRYRKIGFPALYWNLQTTLGDVDSVWPRSYLASLHGRVQFSRGVQF